MQLAYGAVQRAGALDQVAAQLADRPVATLDAPVRAALRLGLFQLLYLDGIPDHAAVDESVQLARRDAPRAAGLVNAVLRRAARERPRPDDAYSVPAWLAQRWRDERDDAQELLAAIHPPARAPLPGKTLLTSPDPPP